MAPILVKKNRQANNMSHMVSSNQKHIFTKTNRFKNVVIFFGLCLSLFMISFCNNWIFSTETSITREIQELKDCKSEELPGNVEELHVTSQELKLKTHQNFIASYLLQESSFERKNKMSKEEGGFLSHLKHLHKIIISKTLGSF